MESTEVAAYWEANAETWTRLVRDGYDVYRDALNTPAFLAMLPPVAGLSGLDLGCGEGANTRRIAGRGARMHALDIAPTFVRHARETEDADPLGITYLVGDGTALPFAGAAFDFVTAFMSLMDMPDQPATLRESCRVLRPGGFLQFSILHPCFAPPYRRVLREPGGSVRALEVGRYFDGVDGEVETWWFSTVPRADRDRVPPFRIPRFHRTLSEWVAMIVGAGLSIERFGEPRAEPGDGAADTVVSDTRVAPLFLHIRARKPA